MQGTYPNQSPLLWDHVMAPMMPPAEGLVPLQAPRNVVIKMADGSWVMTPGISPQTHQHLPQLQYLAIQPQYFDPAAPPMTSLPSLPNHVASLPMTSLPSLPNHVTSLPMTSLPHVAGGQQICVNEVNRVLVPTDAEMNRMLVPTDGRSILVPRRRSGQGQPPRVFPAPATRTLRGNHFATRRRSESFDESVPQVCDTPHKKPSLPFRDFSCLASSTNDVMSRVNDGRFVHKIMEVMEFYFSNDCLSKNAYLLKQISQNDDGFVSIRRIAALKRIKSLTRDVRMVELAVKKSTKLELSKDLTMVRRKTPLPCNIEAPRFVRTVIAINLPQSQPSLESVTSLFRSYGDLTQVRVLKPDKQLPPYLRDYVAWVPDLGASYCALVEFESQDEAQRACREINMMNREKQGLRVALLKPGARLRRTLYRKYKGDVPQDEETNNSNNSYCDVTVDQDYDASVSGSGSESDSASSPIPKYDVARPMTSSPTSSSSDSGCGSGAEEAGNKKRITKRAPRFLAPDRDSSDGDVNTITSRRRPRPNNSPYSVIRAPIGPKDIDAKGFAPGFRKNLVR